MRMLLESSLLTHDDIKLLTWWGVCGNMEKANESQKDIFAFLQVWCPDAEELTLESVTKQFDGFLVSKEQVTSFLTTFPDMPLVTLLHPLCYELMKYNTDFEVIKDVIPNLASINFPDNLSVPNSLL